MTVDLKLNPRYIEVSTMFSFTVNGKIMMMPDNCMWIIKQFMSGVVYEFDNGFWTPFNKSTFALYEGKSKLGKKLVCYYLLSESCIKNKKIPESKFLSSNDLIPRIVRCLIKEFDKYNIKINRLDVEMVDMVIQSITII